MKFIEIAKRRHSTRKYTDYTLTEEDKKSISHLLRSLSSLDKKIALNWVISEDIKKASAFIYSAVKQVPDELVCYGFQGEEIVIGLTRMGFDTCWQASTADGYPARILLGKASGEKAFSEIFVKKGRRPLDSFVQGKENLTPVLKEVLEPAILAPSALNKQPWKFEIRPDERLLISVDNPKGADLKYVELGIVLYHALAAARDNDPLSSVRKVTEQAYELVLGRSQGRA